MGRLYPELAADLRGFPADDYIIFYREVSEGIEIVRVLHGARDIQAVFHDS
jgi:toxin ParE1/3/4